MSINKHVTMFQDDARRHHEIRVDRSTWYHLSGECAISTRLRPTNNDAGAGDELVINKALASTDFLRHTGNQIVRP